MPEIDLPSHNPLCETTLSLPEAGSGIARLARRYPVGQGPGGETLFHSVELDTQIVVLTDPPHALPPVSVDQQQRIVAVESGVYAVAWTERHRADKHRDIDDLHAYRLATDQ